MGSAGGSAPTADADYKSSTLRNQKPPYPMMAYKMKQQGTVVLMAEVLTSGKVGDIKVSSSSGFELLDKSAIEAVRRWTFSPARKDGVVYVQMLRIPITFSLRDK
jgi:protein TonB